VASASDDLTTRCPKSCYGRSLRRSTSSEEGSRIATLEELAQQPDPGGREDEDRGSEQQLMTPRSSTSSGRASTGSRRRSTLSQDKKDWSSLSQDKEDWSSLSDDQKDHFIWLLGSNYIDEERVSTRFAGLLTAYADHQEEAFLATQQVDEARHMQFFDRFYDEVIGMEGDDTAARIDKAREAMNDSFIKLFDDELGEANKRLLENPNDVATKVEFVTVYHMVIEGTLALTSQKFSTDYLEENELLPGFVQGFDNVARDEHRHVAYGTWFLQQTAGKDDLADRMQSKLQELLPVAQGVIVPTGPRSGSARRAGSYTTPRRVTRTGVSRRGRSSRTSRTTGCARCAGRERRTSARWSPARTSRRTSTRRPRVGFLPGYGLLRQDSRFASMGRRGDRSPPRRRGLAVARAAAAPTHLGPAGWVLRRRGARGRGARAVRACGARRDGGLLLPAPGPRRRSPCPLLRPRGR